MCQDRCDLERRSSLRRTPFPSRFLTESGLHLEQVIKQRKNFVLSDMKKILILPMLIPITMICSCRKQDSAAEQQLGQQKAELDAGEKALDERLNALDEKVSRLDQRVRALASREKPSRRPRRFLLTFSRKTLCATFRK